MTDVSKYEGASPTRAAHPLCAELRRLRNAAGLSLERFAQRYGVPAVRMGSWERGDRMPTLSAFDKVAGVFGRRLALVPADLDVPALLAELERLRTFEAYVMASVADRVRADGGDSTPALAAA